MASLAWRAVVGAALTPVRVPGRGGALRLPVLVQALAASLWLPLVLALERAVVSSLPRAPVQALAVASTPREPARLLAFVPRALELLPGPCLSVTADSRHRWGLPYGSEIDCCLLRAVLLCAPGAAHRASPQIRASSA